MNEMIRPEPGQNAIKAPGTIASDGVTVIQGKQHLSSPPEWIGSPLPFQPAQGDALSRNRIPHIQAKANAQQAQLGPSLHHPREKTRQLATLHEQVIGPFDLNREAPPLEPLHHRQCHRQAE